MRSIDIQLIERNMSHQGKWDLPLCISQRTTKPTIRPAYQQRLRSACTFTQYVRCSRFSSLDSPKAVEGTCDQRRLWLECAGAYADLSWRWSTCSFVLRWLIIICAFQGTEFTFEGSNSVKFVSPLFWKKVYSERKVFAPKWVYSKRKEFAPLGSKFFPFRVDQRGANSFLLE